MKKIIVLALVGLHAIPSFAQESNVSEDKNVVKINTLSLIVGTGSIFYESELTDNLSGQLGVAYLNGMRICSVWKFETAFLSFVIKLLKSVELTKTSSAQIA